ncbi:hypothetical protein KPH14_005360 [Odynerus spinipes]|uniref:SEA domain-containing protein n=1 Tax=Odynerus spinipes TaxID=1348599 RepID=A0AAD9RBR3_9HYME|nr:hypothetical protein KPH14_005360 [Odynerus spinipes]
MSQVSFSSTAKILPCFLLLVVFLLVGAYCQEETSQERYKLSQLIPTNLVYQHRAGDESSVWSKKNDTSSLLRSLEENNVMDTSRLKLKENIEEEEEEGGGEEEDQEEGRGDEEEDEEEGGGNEETEEKIDEKDEEKRYEEDEEEAKEKGDEKDVEKEEEDKTDACDPDYITASSKCTRPLSNIEDVNNFKDHEYEEDPSTNQYDAYYYYEDYNDNNGSHYKTVDTETVDYTDSEVPEATTVESPSTKDHEEYVYTDEENYDEDIEEDSSSATNTDAKEVTSMQGSKKNFAVVEPPSKLSSSDDLDSSILIGEAIVSVVTTKSVVNGTISIPTSTSSPMTTEQVAPPPSLTKEKAVDDRALESATTEDSSRILASVQTSRSISGARFLPFPVIDRVEPINSKPSPVTPTKKTFPPPESTESIIDKLDREQSELSSGFLVGGFASAGNALQLDVLSDRDRTTRRKFVTSSGGNTSTTSRTPVITKFVPRRYNDKTESNGATSSTLRPKIAFKWPSGKTTTPLNSDEFKSTTQASTASTKKVNAQVVFQDVNAFLPPGFKLSKEDQQELTERSPLSDILSKSKVDLTRLLPSDYNKKKNNEASTTLRIPKIAITTSAPSIDRTTEKISIQNLFDNSKFDVSALLPRDYVEKAKNVPSETKAEVESHDSDNSTSTSTVSNETKAANGFKIVFPSRPGGRKHGHKLTTPQPHRADGLPVITPRIQKGWPTRATTEFTGWPTPSTTPISIEKLLEVARTATETSVNTSVVETTSAVSVTSTTTTTTTTPRSTTIGICEDECEVAGTIRIIGNTTWLPELLDRNTKEWQQLANEIEREMNFVFSKSTVLMNWYKKIRIDSFSQGSILVDFFIELVNLPQRINTQELKVIFHDSLRTFNSSWNETKTKGSMKLGAFTIDPKSTDFVVIPKVPMSDTIENENRLIPQWAVVIIVIGVGGLLFIIIFGVSVLTNRRNVSKLKPSVSTLYEEGIAKNMLASSLNRSNDYPKQIHTIWTDPDVSWNDKSFESTSNKVLVDRSFPDGKKYNLHDSWRSEWNGYYSKPSHGSSKHSGYHNHPDYDTNF